MLTLIASFEAGIAHELELEFKRLERKLSMQEVEALFGRFESHPLFKPLILDARTRWPAATWAFGMRHHKLEAISSPFRSRL